MKVDDSFQDSLFFLDGFGTPFRIDWNRNGEGDMLFIRNDIPAKVVSTVDKSNWKLLLRAKFSKDKMAIELLLKVLNLAI